MVRVKAKEKSFISFFLFYFILKMMSFIFYFFFLFKLIYFSFFYFNQEWEKRQKKVTKVKGSAEQRNRLVRIPKNALFVFISSSTFFFFHLKKVFFSNNFFGCLAWQDLRADKCRFINEFGNTDSAILLLLNIQK